MPELNAEKINWSERPSEEKIPDSSGELSPEQEVIRSQEKDSMEKINSKPFESTERTSGNPAQEVAADTNEWERKLASLLQETDPSEEQGEKQITNLIKNISENLILKNDSSPNRITKEKDLLIDRLSEGNLGTYGYLQEIFNEEISKKLDRKTF